MSIIPLISFLLGIVLINLLRRQAERYKILIFKDTPLVGGVSIGLSFLFACLFGSLLYRNLSSQITGVIFASTIMLIFGVIDDLRELTIWAKFLVQIIATSLLIFFGIRTQIVYIGNLFNLIITFLWVIGITNAFNHLDIMDGVAAGVAIIIIFSFLTISLLNKDFNTTILCLALSGAVFSLLIFNLPPAKIYMGNSGSHFLGFTLAAIAIVISYAPLERKIALFSPLLILGFPIYDTAFLVLMRIKKGMSPFKKSDDHLALRLLALGYSKRKTLLVMLSLCLFFSVCGIFVSQVSNLIGIMILSLLILVNSIIAYQMSKIRVDG